MALLHRPTRLPFYFEWLGDSMIVTADRSGTDALPPGTAIASLNGLPAGQVLQTLLPYARADGHNDGKRRSLLGVRGTETIESFDVFHGLVLPPDGAEHHLQIVTPEGARRSVSLPAIDLATRRAAKKPTALGMDTPWWTWLVRPDGIAVLTMSTWAMFRSKWDWRSWLEERLDSLAGARGLVIDIRENEGGDDCGSPILVRLIDRDLQAWDFEERLRFTEVQPPLGDHVTTWDKGFRTLGVGARPLGDGFYERPTKNVTAALQPSGRHLTLPVAALMGPANSSATFGFLRAARVSGKIRLFGETSGGNQRGINGGAFFFVKLPGSGIEFDLPLIGYYPHTPQPDAGLPPDVVVVRTAADIAQGKDPAMAAAVLWISGRPKGNDAMRS